MKEKRKRKPYFIRLLRYYFKCLAYLFIPPKDQGEFE